MLEMLLIRIHITTPPPSRDGNSDTTNSYRKFNYFRSRQSAH